MESAEKQRKKPHFDRTINLGHVLTALTTLVTMGLAIATVYVNGKVKSAMLTARISQVEMTNLRMSENMKSLTDSMKTISDLQIRMQERSQVQERDILKLQTAPGGRP